MFFMSKMEVSGQENAELSSKPLLVISNHKSFYDPLVIAVSLKVFSKVYPLRFITKDAFFKNWFSRFIFTSMGSFPAYRGEGLDKSLEIPEKILKEKSALVFFPEGKCIREDMIGEGKVGAAILALKVPETQILPMAIRDSHKIGRPFRRPKVGVSIGKPFYLKDIMNVAPETSPEEATKEIMKVIRDLYEQ